MRLSRAPSSPCCLWLSSGKPVPGEYAVGDVAELYQRRGLLESDIRAIKISLGMDILRCKTPALVRKEMWACLLAYNLIRRILLQSAKALSDDGVAPALIEIAAATCAGHPAGRRPGRVEPGAIQRRPKPHDLLSQARAEARAERLAKKSP